MRMDQLIIQELLTFCNYMMFVCLFVSVQVLGRITVAVGTMAAQQNLVSI